jgi:hypothetical protein
MHTYMHTYIHTYIHSGHSKIQNTLRKYNVLQAIVDFLEELERDMILSLAFKDAMSLFTLAKVQTT